MLLSNLFPLGCQVLLKPIYGIKACPTSKMLCGFITASNTPRATTNLLPGLLVLMFLQHLLVNYHFKSWNCPSCKKPCRRDTDLNVLEKLDVSWYQCDFIQRLAKLFARPLSLQAILMNLMCVDQRSGGSLEAFKRIDNSLRATFFNLCWRQELEQYLAVVSFSFLLEVTMLQCHCVKAIAMVLSDLLESREARTSTEKRES